MQPLLTSILVAVDFTPGSRAALALGTELARLHHARLSVLHVIEAAAVMELAAVAEADEGELRARVEHQIRETLNSECSRHGVPPTTERIVRAGVPFEEILHQIRITRADLLILGTTSQAHHGPGGLAQRCLRKAPVEVMLASPDAAPRLRHVAAFLDFSPLSARVLEWAASLARQADGSLSVVNVYEGPWFRLHVPVEAGVTDDHRQRDLDRRRKRLDDFLATQSLEGVHVACHVATHPSASRGILDYLAANSVDLAVLGTRGRSESHYVLMGSVAARVLQHQPASVLMVKPGNVRLPRSD